MHLIWRFVVTEKLSSLLDLSGNPQEGFQWFQVFTRFCPTLRATKLELSYLARDFFFLICSSPILVRLCKLSPSEPTVGENGLTCCVFRDAFKLCDAFMATRSPSLKDLDLIAKKKKKKYQWRYAKKCSANLKIIAVISKSCFLLKRI